MIPLLDGPPVAGLVSFQLDTTSTTLKPSQMVKRLGDQRIWIRDLADPSCLRACTHVCSNDNDLQQLVAAIQHALVTHT